MKNTNDIHKNIKLIEIDPWLRPYSEDLLLRMDKYNDTKKLLLGSKRKFKSFANGHLYYGIHLTKGGWIYREWAPGAKEIYLYGDFNDWNKESHPLKRMENGNWELFIEGVNNIYHGCKVKIRVVTEKKVYDRLPSYINTAVQAEGSSEFIGEIWKPKKNFKWTDDEFKIKKNSQPFIYEAHVGMAQDKEGIGSFKEFTANILPRIKENGYNVIQLMGIMDHPYYASFGYHVANFFAVSSRFGTPDDLKDLIDTAHSMGIAVLMDLVHSHVVKNTTEGINEFDGTDYQYFHEGKRGNHPAWDSKLFDYSKPEVMHFLLSNIKYWMEEFHLDGFRFDGVTSMIYHNHGLGTNFDNYDKYFSMNTDIDAITYLQCANELVREIKGYAVTIAEDMSGMPGMCIPIEDGGIGFDYRLSMGIPDYWIRTLKERTDEEWDLKTLWNELTSRRPSEKTIGYMESHDQALVGDKTIMFRLADKEMYWHMKKDDNNIIIDRAMSLHKLMRFITLSLGGEGYLNFIGNEFGHPEWIDFPREGNDWNYKYAKRQWSLVDNHELKYEFLNNFDRDMIHFVKKHHLLKANDLENLWIDNLGKLIAYKKAGLIFLFNFNAVTSFAEYTLPTNNAGSYKVVFNSDTDIYGGKNRICEKTVYNTMPLADKDGITGIKIYSPARTLLVLKSVSK